MTINSTHTLQNELKNKTFNNTNTTLFFYKKLRVFSKIYTVLCACSMILTFVSFTMKTQILSSSLNIHSSSGTVGTTLTNVEKVTWGTLLPVRDNLLQICRLRLVCAKFHHLTQKIKKKSDFLEQQSEIFCNTCKKTTTKLYMRNIHSFS